MKEKFLIIKTTYPKISEAKKIAQILLNKKLAACIEFSKINSNFIWEEKIISQNEILVIIKTKANLYKKIESEILANHPYKIPQILSITVFGGFNGYFDWISQELSATHNIS